MAIAGSSKTYLSHDSDRISFEDLHGFTELTYLTHLHNQTERLKQQSESYFCLPNAAQPKGIEIQHDPKFFEDKVQELAEVKKKMGAWVIDRTCGQSKVTSAPGELMKDSCKIKGEIFAARIKNVESLINYLNNYLKSSDGNASIYLEPNLSFLIKDVECGMECQSLYFDHSDSAALVFAILGAFIGAAFLFLALYSTAGTLLLAMSCFFLGMLAQDDPERALNDELVGYEQSVLALVDRMQNNIRTKS